MNAIANLTYRQVNNTTIRYVPCRDGWHVYITGYDPFPLLWASTLGEAITKGRKLALELGYDTTKDKVEDYK